MAIDGTWKITIKGPTGPMAITLVLATVNGVLTGVQSGQGDSADITDAKFDGKNIFWISHIVEPIKLKVEFAGVVDGGHVSGNIKAGFMGTFSFSGEKQ